MRLRRRRPARCASTTLSCSSCTLNKPLGNFSRTVPVTSMLSSLLIPPLESGLRAGAASDSTLRPARLAALSPLPFPHWRPADLLAHESPRTRRGHLHPATCIHWTEWPKNARKHPHPIHAG